MAERSFKSLGARIRPKLICWNVTGEFGSTFRCRCRLSWNVSDTQPAEVSRRKLGRSSANCCYGSLTCKLSSLLEAPSGMDLKKWMPQTSAESENEAFDFSFKLEKNFSFKSYFFARKICRKCKLSQDATMPTILALFCSSIDHATATIDYLLPNPSSYIGPLPHRECHLIYLMKHPVCSQVG